MRPLEIFFHFGPFVDGVPFRLAMKVHAKSLYALGVVASRDTLPSFMDSQTKGAQFITELPSPTCTACIAALGSLNDLHRWSSTDFQSRFPGARLKAFVSFSRQDREMEARFAWASLFGGLSDVRRWLQAELLQTYYDYAKISSHLERIFGKDNICVTTWGEDPDREQRAQDAFWNFAGIVMPQESATGLRYLAPPVNLSPGRDFYEFMRQSVRVYPMPIDENSPWIRATLTFPKQSLQLLAPEKRQEILEHWKPSNLRLASMLGRGAAFDYSAEEHARAESEWREYTGLTPEAALALAERLERSFAKELLDRFDVMPGHILTYPQRIIHQALKEAAGVSSIIVSAPPPKLSVLTLTYNHASFIRNCMDSVLAQRTNFPIQHIIADDCSNDGAQEIILEYAAKHSHIVPVIQTERSGGYRNLRSMFEMARTEYVALCDGDDYFSDPLKLQTQVDFLDTHKECGLCFHVARVTYEGEPGKERFYPELDTMPRGVRTIYNLVDLLRYNFMQSNTPVYRWRFRNGLPDWFRDDLHPSDWYWHILHAEIGPIGFINKIMSVYRRHEKSVYYQAEVDPLMHRCKKGLGELGTYDAINRHFNGKYQSIFFDMANGVFVDWLMASEIRDIDVQPLMEEAVEKFPDFSRNFLNSLAL